MKKVLLAVTLLASLGTALTANAANHHHMRQLAKAGCTQVQEANGLCPAATTIHRHTTAERQAIAEEKAREWDRQHAQQFNERNDDQQVRLFCDDLPVDATNSEIKNCVKSPKPTRMQCADLPVDATNAERRNCIE